MSITRNNYEHFFLDFAEGRLDSALMAELERFLDCNPDLKMELDAFESFSIEVEPAQFKGREALKKNIIAVGSITEKNYQELLVASLENDLSPSRAQELETFIGKNLFVEKEKVLFEKCKLQPGTISFPEKKKLKKAVIVSFNRRVAAVLALAASVLLLLYVNLNEEKTMTSEKNEKREKGLIQKAIPPVFSNKKIAGKTETEHTDSIKKKKQRKHAAKTPDANAMAQTLITDSESNGSKNSAEFGEGGGEAFKVSGVLKNEVTVAEKSPNVNFSEEKSELKLSGGYSSAIPNPESLTIHSPSSISREGIVVAETSDPEREELTLKEFLSLRLKNNLLKRQTPGKKEDAKITGIDLAEAAVKSISGLLRVNLKINRQFHDNGELAAISISSPGFEISRTMHGE